MAADPVVEYWAELMGRTPFTPEVMAQWKRVMDHGLEAWSRALSEVMATEDFAQLLGTSIEQWLAAQASFTGKPAPVAGQADVLVVLAAEVRRLEERLRQLEERLASAAESAAAPSVQASAPSVHASRRRSRRRRAA
jgi:PAS domain-containing protein